MVAINPDDFALITALYRSSVDGRKFLYEAVLSEKGKYNIPDDFTSRTSEVLEVYMKSLGIKMETIIDDSEFIGEPEDDTEIVGYKVKNNVIFCHPNEMYYLKKLQKLYKRYQKENPDDIDNMEDLWEYLLDHLPFKKKYLTDNIRDLFSNNLQAFS